MEQKFSGKPGYEYLLSYKLTVEIERLTEIFCKTYLDQYKDRRYIEQMNSSARSMPRNIVEGYKRLGLKDYIEFLSFSRASGEELLKDFERLAERWKIKTNREIWENREKWERNGKFEIPFPPINPIIPINFLISLIFVTNYLLDRQISSLEKKFIQEGGYSENLAKKRREFRGF